ncbi:PRC-barrel domain-containing protein [Pseudorhodoplanes sp.]|uniref:PRC-barrel domain-containing protein n=1 Tax=Pseudorhodoplanes sp. TaxID=1934341 RepID=UPI00391CA0FF
MVKTLMISTALGSLMIGGALAQVTQPTAQPMEQQRVTPPDATPQQAPSASQQIPSGVKAAERAAQSGPSGDVTFIRAQGADQWLSSNFVGVDVVGPENQKIGDISDILFEKNGTVVGYVVSVGGFLGIGAKSVALAPSSFEVVPANAERATTGAATAARADEIKLKLNMTKDQLTDAASFETKSEQDAKARSATRPAPGGAMTRPQQ